MNGTTSDVPRLRVATYCRIAGGEDPSPTLDEQRTHYERQIEATPGWTMAGIFADIGDSRSARPQFQKLLRKCRQRKIDLILVRSASRFSRCYLDCLNVVRELRELGVAVIFEKENINTLTPQCEAADALMDEFARLECENLTLNSVHTHYMTLGKKHKKGTWKKTIRLTGHPDKTILFKME